MNCSSNRLPILLCALVLRFSECVAWDHDWTVVTLARDGSWGVASHSSQPQAMAEAIRRCKATARDANDCGAHSAAAKGGWIVANLCGGYKLIATGISLTDAEQEALNREISLQLFYVSDLPPCKRVVTVDPDGTIVPSNQQFSTARERAR